MPILSGMDQEMLYVIGFQRTLMKRYIKQTTACFSRFFSWERTPKYKKRKEWPRMMFARMWMRWCAISFRLLKSDQQLNLLCVETLIWCGLLRLFNLLPMLASLPCTSCTSPAHVLESTAVWHYTSLTQVYPTVVHWCTGIWRKKLRFRSSWISMALTMSMQEPSTIECK